MNGFLVNSIFRASGELVHKEKDTYLICAPNGTVAIAPLNAASKILAYI